MHRKSIIFQPPFLNVLDSRLKIYSLGDSAAVLDLGNEISVALNQKILAVEKRLQQKPFEGLRDIIVAYSSITVYYDPLAIKKKIAPSGTVCQWVGAQLREAFDNSFHEVVSNGHLIRLPVCYDPVFGPDLDKVAAEKNMSRESLIALHTSRPYRVYMIGFLPGFSYMGELDQQLGMKRKPIPEPVVAGSVGITSLQTGIYPLNSPGGWHIIGRTPVKMFDSASLKPVNLKAGDQVQFFTISKEEFDRQIHS